jgi:hypothetical protein
MCRLRRATTWSIASLEIVDGAAELACTEVAKRASRLSRCLRDVHTLRGHVATNGDVMERVAQADLGLLDPDMLVESHEQSACGRASARTLT